jgi:hypothetical protein
MVARKEREGEREEQREVAYAGLASSSFTPPGPPAYGIVPPISG